MLNLIIAQIYGIFELISLSLITAGAYFRVFSESINLYEAELAEVTRAGSARRQTSQAGESVTAAAELTTHLA